MNQESKSQYLPIFSCGNVSTIGKGLMLFLRPGGIIGISIVGGFYLAHGAVPIDAKWHHLAFVIAGPPDQVFAYLDGKPVTFDVTPQGGIKFDTAPGRGSIGSGSTYRFDGAIDDLRIYNRALSADEIANLFAIETAPYPQLSITKDFHIDLAAEVDRSYRLEKSADLQAWAAETDAFKAEETVFRFDVPSDGNLKFFRVVEVP
jgi:hypothetical protein